MKILKFNNVKQTLLSIAILHSKRFQEARKSTPEGRKLFNKEIELAKQKVREYGIKLSKPLPEKFELNEEVIELK